MAKRGGAVEVFGGGQGTIVVVGLREFQAELRRADALLPRELKRAFDEIGRVILVPEITRRMRETLVDKSRTKLLNTVRAVSQQREGRIIEGKAATPYAGWWEFGGSTKRRIGGVNREFVSSGRTLYPALDAKREEIALATDAAIDRLTLELRSSG